jgi:hypothetical protein
MEVALLLGGFYAARRVEMNRLEIFDFRLRKIWDFRFETLDLRLKEICDLRFLMFLLVTRLCLVNASS